MLEHNGRRYCQAFMLMLHSEGEWWISAAAALDRLHAGPPATADARSRGTAAKRWAAAQPEPGGRGRRVALAPDFLRVLIIVHSHKLAPNPGLFNLRLALAQMCEIRNDKRVEEGKTSGLKLWYVFNDSTVTLM